MNDKQKEIKREIKQLEKQLKNDKDFLKLLKVCEKAGDEVAIQCGVMITEEELAQTICDVNWDKIPAITKNMIIAVNMTTIYHVKYILSNPKF